MFISHLYILCVFCLPLRPPFFVLMTTLGFYLFCSYFNKHFYILRAFPFNLLQISVFTDVGVNEDPLVFVILS